METIDISETMKLKKSGDSRICPDCKTVMSRSKDPLPLKYQGVPMMVHFDICGNCESMFANTWEVFDKYNTIRKRK